MGDTVIVDQAGKPDVREANYCHDPRAHATNSRTNSADFRPGLSSTPLAVSTACGAHDSNGFRNVVGCQPAGHNKRRIAGVAGVQGKQFPIAELTGSTEQSGHLGIEQYHAWHARELAAPIEICYHWRQPGVTHPKRFHHGAVAQLGQLFGSLIAVELQEV